MREVCGEENKPIKVNKGEEEKTKGKERRTGGSNLILVAWFESIRVIFRSKRV